MYVLNVNVDVFIVTRHLGLSSVPKVLKIFIIYVFYKVTIIKHFFDHDILLFFSVGLSNLYKRRVLVKLKSLKRGNFLMTI